MSLPTEAHDLFDGVHFAHVATLMSDGSPQTTVVWIDRDGDVVRFNTARGGVKAEKLERDSRVAISVHDPENPYRYVQVRDRAQLVHEGAEEHIHSLAHKYMGEDYPLQESEQRVIVQVEPDSVDVRG